MIFTERKKKTTAASGLKNTTKRKEDETRFVENIMDEMRGMHFIQFFSQFSDSINEGKTLEIVHNCLLQLPKKLYRICMARF